MKHLDVDIIGIADTHLTGDTQLELSGYKWFGNNRKHLHVRFLVSQYLMYPLGLFMSGIDVHLSLFVI